MNKVVIFTLLLISICSWGTLCRATPSRALTVYMGQSNDNDLLELIRFQMGSFEQYSVLGLRYSEVFYDQPDYYSLDWAGHIVKHFEKLELFEFDALAIFNWKWFPWNRFLVTSLGIGEGLSVATGHPSSESVSQNIRAPLLNYLFVNVQFSLPSLPDWGLDFIIHHRSGIYGLIAGIRGGSNYLCLGITRRF